MTISTVERLSEAYLAGKDLTIPTAGVEIARFTSIMKNWEEASLTLQGATDAETLANIQWWLDDFEFTYRKGMLSVNLNGGYAGYFMANEVMENVIDKASFLEVYQTRIRALTDKDFTRAYMLERGLAERFGNNYKEFYKLYDDFVKEGTQLGFSLQDISRRFMGTEIFKDNIYLTPISQQNIDRVSKGLAPIRWKPSAYTSMYASTRSAEMQDIITGEEMDSLGMDIVQVSSHNTTTPICQQYEGKFYSRYGQTPGLSQLPIPPPFHPNCRHILLPISPRESTKSMQRVNSIRNTRLSKQSKSWTASDRKAIKKQTDYIKIERVGS